VSDPDQSLGHTVDADEATMAEMRRYAEAARKSAADVTLPVPDEIAVSRPTDAPTDVPDVPAVADAVVITDEPHTIAPASAPVGVPVPPDLPGERWQPPPRTVLPSTPTPDETRRSPGLWKPAAIVLGAIAAVLAAVLVFGATSDEDPPGGTTVPGSPVATSAPQTGLESDPGDD